MLKNRIVGFLGLFALLCSGLIPFYFIVRGIPIDVNIYLICSGLGFVYVIISLYSFYTVKTKLRPEGIRFFYLPYSVIVFTAIRGAALLMLIIILQMNQIRFYAIIPAASAFFVFTIARFYICYRFQLFSITFFTDGIYLDGTLSKTIFYADVHEVKYAHACVFILQRNGLSHTLDSRFVPISEKSAFEGTLDKALNRHS